MAPSLLLLLRYFPAREKSFKTGYILLCAGCPDCVNSIAARDILTCIGNPSTGRCLSKWHGGSTQVRLRLIFGTQALFTYIIVPTEQH